ncbi:MAG TPA: transporter substrate-binding domain-containing protein [Coriobacteriia bacterium]
MGRTAARSTSDMRGGRLALSVLAALAVLTLLVAGCAQNAAEETLTPKIAPPAIGKAGVLRAAIDLSYPPFGGVVKGSRAGLDIDVASALARELGLKLEIVEASPTAGAQLLRDGKVDVMLGGVAIDAAVQLDVAFAGPYVNDAPAIFAAAEGSATSGIPAATMASIGAGTIAAQRESLAYWLVTEEYGEETVLTFPTLREAMSEVASGNVEYAVGDGLVGTYMLRQFPTLRLAGQLAPAAPVGVTVAKDATELEQAVRDALDRLSSGGVLETLRRTWLADAPRFQGSTDASGTLETSLTTETSPAP